MQKRPKHKLRLEYRQYNLDPDFPIKALLLDRFIFPKAQLGELSYMHLHNHIELGYCYAGSSTLAVEDEDVQETHTGDITLICPFAMHGGYRTPSQNSVENIWEYLYVDMAQLFSDFFPNGFPGQELFAHHSVHFPTVARNEEYPAITLLLKDIFEEFRQERPHYKEAVKAKLLVFFLEFSRIIPETVTPGLSYRHVLVVEPAIIYIQDHSSEHLDAELLSGLCHMSVTNFRRIFKSIMGQTPTDYITAVRIRESCRLLYETELPILDIAMKIGYNAICSFNRNFIELMHVTPTQWRNEKRQIPKKGLFFSVFES